MKIKEEIKLDWLERYRVAQPHFGLERMERLLALRGNPHLKLSVIHLAGTNGKGSTIASLSQLLQAHGLRVAVFSSPYLLDYNEQIAINGQAISDQDLQHFLQIYQDLLESETSKESFAGLTEFEIITALAYDYFAQQKVDVALIEVGMGGLLDSTNVCQPDLTAITTIGLDHVALLGNSLAEIAQQKAGIIKEQTAVVTGKIDPQALEVIERIAQERKAPIYSYQKDYQAIYQTSAETGEVFSFSNAYRTGEIYQTPLMGIHQVDNTGLALQLCDCYCQLKKLPLLKTEQVKQALEKVTWPGRMELIRRTPLILLDGAHNPHAMESLVTSLEQHYQGVQKNILFSCIQTKSLTEMLAMLKEVPQADLTLTTFADQRAFSKDQMQETAHQEDLNYADWQEYLDKYLQGNAHRADMLIITGSLYFLSQVRQYLTHDKVANDI